jgi:hypothetical protein
MSHCYVMSHDDSPASPSAVVKGAMSFCCAGGTRARPRGRQRPLRARLSYSAPLDSIPLPDALARLRPSSLTGGAPARRSTRGRQRCLCTCRATRCSPTWWRRTLRHSATRYAPACVRIDTAGHRLQSRLYVHMRLRGTPQDELMAELVAADMGSLSGRITNATTRLGGGVRACACRVRFLPHRRFRWRSFAWRRSPSRRSTWCR